MLFSLPGSMLISVPDASIGKKVQRGFLQFAVTRVSVKEDAAPAHFISLIFALLAPRCLRFVFMNITFQKRSRFFSPLSLPPSKVQTKFASKTLTIFLYFWNLSRVTRTLVCLSNLLCTPCGQTFVWSLTILG